MNDPNIAKRFFIRHFPSTARRGPISIAGTLVSVLLSLALHAQSTIQFSSRTLTVAETAEQAELSVERANNLETEVSVEYFTVDLTATAGQDYTAVSGTLSFAPGVTNQTIIVPILNDALFENLERFRVTLTNATGEAVLGSMRIVTVSIQDNDTGPYFASTTHQVDENVGSVVIRVNWGFDGDEPLTVDYATVDGTALAGTDYEAASGTLTFEPGESFKEIPVVIKNDGVKETTKGFQVQLANASVGGLGVPAATTVTILDNDPGPSFQFSAYQTVEDAGSVRIGVNRGGDGDQPVTVDYETLDGTALAGTDYEAVSSTLTFAVGQWVKEIAVAIVNDGVNDPAKNFQVRLSNASSGTMGSLAVATISILASTPEIYQQPVPASQSVSLGVTVMIRVSAKGARMQWQKRVGDGEFTDIPGATGEVLEWSHPTADQTGEYRFIVSSSTGESVTSQIATVVVDPTFTKITDGPVVTDAVVSWSGMFGDYDGDGLLDLVVLGDYWNPGANTRLYHNEGQGQFQAITEGPWFNLTDRIMYSPWADPDNDGDLDLLLCGFEGNQPLYFENQGDGTFNRSRVAPSWTSDGTQISGWAAAWGDFDNDGLLDTVVGAQITYPLRNNGDSTFTVLKDSPIYKEPGSPHCYQLVDYDNDGDLDLFMPEEFMSSRLYRNDGQGQFVNVTVSVLQNRLGRGLNGAWADFDNDGDLDLYFMSYEEGPERFLLSNGDGTFVDWNGEPNSLLQVGNGTPVWGDYDNDGLLDLLITQAGSHCRLFRNSGDGDFLEVMVGSPVTDPSSAQSAAWADYDNDGDLDLFVACRGGHNYLYQNNGNGNHWLKVRLNGTASNSHGIGAKVLAQTTDGLEARLMRQITAGSVSQELEAHFGLGDATKVDTLRIEWPSGIVQELKDVAVDQILEVVETQGVTLPEMTIEAFGRDAQGIFQATVNCPVEGVLCLMEASSDLERWSKVQVRTNLTGTVEFTDAHAASSLTRFYRVLVP